MTERSYEEVRQALSAEYRRHAESMIALRSELIAAHEREKPQDLGPDEMLFTLHYHQSGFARTMTSISQAALEHEAFDMAEKGWAYPEKLVDPMGANVPIDPYGIGDHRG